MNNPLTIDTDLAQALRLALTTGTAANSRHAYVRDAAYFWAWVEVALGDPPCYPANGNRNAPALHPRPHRPRR